MDCTDKNSCFFYPCNPCLKQFFAPLPLCVLALRPLYKKEAALADGFCEEMPILAVAAAESHQSR